MLEYNSEFIFLRPLGYGNEPLGIVGNGYASRFGKECAYSGMLSITGVRNCRLFFYLFMGDKLLISITMTS